MASQSSPFESVSNKASDMIDKVKSSSPQSEGKLTQAIESQTAKVPSVGWLGLALGSIGISMGLAAFGRRKEFANFVGLWAPTFLLIGIYNKLVKLEGSDAFNKSSGQSAA